MWWVGIMLLVAGEVFNITAFGYAPISVLAPLGTLSIISGAISGWVYLGESIKWRNVGGMLMAAAGACVIVLSARREEPQLTPEDIVQSLCQLRFLIYVAVSGGLMAVLLVADNYRPSQVISLDEAPQEPKTLGERYMLIRVTLTALFSGYTVLCTKSISSLLAAAPHEMFSHWVTYMLIALLLTGALSTLYYTNKALSSFESTRVLPAEFAAFTLTAVLGSAMLYNDFDEASMSDFGLFALGCATIFGGVYFISSGHK